MDKLDHRATYTYLGHIFQLLPLPYSIVKPQGVYDYIVPRSSGQNKFSKFQT